MKHNQQFFKVSPLQCEIKLESVCDKKGNVMHMVTVCRGELQNHHVFFKKFASALDYIDTNFTE